MHGRKNRMKKNRIERMMTERINRNYQEWKEL